MGTQKTCGMMRSYYVIIIQSPFKVQLLTLLRGPISTLALMFEKIGNRKSSLWPLNSCDLIPIMAIAYQKKCQLMDETRFSSPIQRPRLSMELEMPTIETIYLKRHCHYNAYLIPFVVDINEYHTPSFFRH